jgi:hypothetical protein
VLKDLSLIDFCHACWLPSGTGNSMKNAGKARRNVWNRSR